MFIIAIKCSTVTVSLHNRNEMNNKRIYIEQNNNGLRVAVTDKNNILQVLEQDSDLAKPLIGSIYIAQIKQIDKKAGLIFLSLGNEVDGVANLDDYSDKAISSKIPVEVTNTTNQAKTETKTIMTKTDIGIARKTLIYKPYIKNYAISGKSVSKQTRLDLEEKAERLLHDINDHRFILRTAAQDFDYDFISGELKSLSALWQDISSEINNDSKTGLIFKGENAIGRCVRDYLSKNDNFTIEVYPNTLIGSVEKTFEKYYGLCPKNIKASSSDSLFDFAEINDQIQALQSPVHNLKCGANIIIEQTSALTSVDVNRSSSSKSGYLINLEAIKETLRIIRLKNIGGIIIIDLLKMKSAHDRQNLTKHAKSLAEHEHKHTIIHGITRLGLMEISRKR